MSEKGEIRFKIDGDALSALLNRDKGEAGVGKGYRYTIPSQWFDLARIGSIERAFLNLGIVYGKIDVYPAFKSEEELNDALLKVYKSDWPEKWAIEDYLFDKGLIKRPEKKE